MVSLLLACLDLIESAVENIEQDGAENIDPSDLIQKLERLANENDGDEIASQMTVVETGQRGFPSVDTFPPRDVNLLQITVNAAADCESASIRKYMAYSVIEKNFGNCMVRSIGRGCR